MYLQSFQSHLSVSAGDSYALTGLLDKSCLVEADEQSLNATRWQSRRGRDSFSTLGTRGHRGS